MNNLLGQTALKWSAHLSDEYKIGEEAIHLDEVNDRLYVAGTITDPLDPSITNSLSYPYNGETDAAVICLSADGTTVHWFAHWGGSGGERPSAISTNAAGDVFIAGRTASADFPTVTPYDASLNSTHSSGVTFITRLNASGTTIDYSTYIGGRADNDMGKSMVVEGDLVYYGTGVKNEPFPTTAGAYQPTAPTGSSDAVLFALNTAQGGTAGLVWSTYFGGNFFQTISDVKKSPDGELVIIGYTGLVGDGSSTFPVTANAIQSPTSIMATQYTDGEYVAKFTTNGALTYSTLLFPIVGSNYTYSNGHGIDVDANGNIYVVSSLEVVGASYTTIANQQLIDFSNSISNIITVSKIPANLSPVLEYLTIFSKESSNFEPDVEVDEKNRPHLILPVGPSHFETAGNLPSINVPTEFSAYGILSESGASVEYMTTLNYYYELVVGEDGTAYLLANTPKYLPTTPTYYDADAGIQKTVFKSTTADFSGGSGLLVFHDPLPNDNTITDFAGGNNTFCIDGLIYQDPNEGPIDGSTVTYQSGDGSSAMDNLPDLYINEDGTTIAHPIPESPDSKFQWEKSYDGTTWETIPSAELSVLKPESEPAAATVRYRRLLITAACDTTISNIATATIVGTFGLDISLAEVPVYYCPGTTKSLGVTITGATGNIDWQWYNGFAPLTTEISPASGTNTAQGTFTADIPTSATEGGTYRLVVTDANGCKKEAFVTTEPLTTPAFQGEMAVLCPGTTPSITLGSATNPDFDYSWTGPGGFTSSVANPTVTATGTYTLQVKLKSDASFCAGGATSVTIGAPTSHDAALTTIADSEFCQSDSPAPIGLGGTPPSGYVFQWVPGINLDNAQAYSPNFDPGSLPFDIYPISTIEYTFTALRLSDGCIFETTTTVSDTARALAQAGIDKPSCENSQIFGAAETEGNYWEWRAVATTFPGDIAALTADAAFSMDGSSTNLGTNKFLTGGFPSHTDCYTIDYEIKGAYVPFPTNCFTRDTVRLFYCPDCGAGDWCTDLTSNSMGTDGACAGTSTIIGGSALDGLTYTWTTYSVDGVVQPANTAPQGLFEMNADGSQGAALVGGAAHPAQGIADFDDATWGWAGSNVVIYHLTANGNFGAAEIDCHRDIQVFSAADATPVIGVLDQAFCTVEAPAIRLGSAGKDAPYTLSGVDYTQAPNSAFDWEWTVLSGTTGSITSGGTSEFPTLEPTDPTYYQVMVTDPITGCIAKDTLFADIVSVITNAGDDISAVCNGTLVQLGNGSQDNHTYSWSPTSGLNSPIGTPNSMVGDPYLLVGSNATYTVTVTESTTGCQATDAIAITTTNSAPPAPDADGPYNACADAVFEIGPFNYSTDYVNYSWSAVGGSADIAWLSATDVLNPTVTLPASFSSAATFRLTVSQGNCGSSFRDYVINDNSPAPNLGANVSYNCSAATIELSNGSNSSYTYAWTPNENLYTNSDGTSVYNGAFSTSRYRIYASPGTTTTYTLIMKDRETGCEGTDDIRVTVPANAVADAGSDINYCPGDGAVALAASGTGSSFAWTATGYNSNPYGVPATPSSGEQSTMLGYLNTTSGLSVNFEQTFNAPGKYVYTLTANDGACSNSDEVTIIVPDFAYSNLAGLSTAVCEGESVQLGIATPPLQLTYSWRVLTPTSQANSIDNPSISNPIVNPTETTTYELTYTDAVTGCSDTKTVTVTVTPKLTVADVDMAVQCGPVSPIDLTAQIPNYGTYFNQNWSMNTPNGQAVPCDTTMLYSHSFDNLTGWTIDPNSTDNATTGFWEVGDPNGTSYQNENAFEGSNALITGLNNTSSGSHDVDGGMTSIQSPVQNIPNSAQKAVLSFYYFYGHNSSGSGPGHFFRVTVKGSTDRVVLNRLNENSVTTPDWELFSVDISEYIGQSVSVLFEIDAQSGIAEAGVDLFDISTASTNILVSPTQTTDYYVTLENEFGCPNTAQVTVNIEEAVTPIIVPAVNVDCSINTIDLADYQGNPSDPSYTLEWHDANDNMAASLLGSTIVGSGTYYLFERTGIDCISMADSLEVSAAHCPGTYDWGDLPDTSAATATLDYQTTAANNGPNHLIIPDLHLGSTVDEETDGQPSTDALGDDIDEDGLLIFQSLDISPGSTFRLPLSYTNGTGNDAHIEAWIDWNANGEFDAGEQIFDEMDAGSSAFNQIEITAPTDVVIGVDLGLRIRISNQDNMTPYGRISSGEVEDYLINLNCNTQNCAPITITINRK